MGVRTSTREGGGGGRNETNIQSIIADMFFSQKEDHKFTHCERLYSIYDILILEKDEDGVTFRRY